MTNQTSKISSDLGTYDTMQWERICDAKHPTDGQRGVLVRNKRTGIFCLALGGTMRSVPRRWAAQLTEEQAAK